MQDLSSCINLKWLSVVENKLESLKGVEGLTKLTVSFNILSLCNKSSFSFIMIFFFVIFLLGLYLEA